MNPSLMCVLPVSAYIGQTIRVYFEAREKTTLGSRRHELASGGP